MATMLKARVARWVACVVAVGAYALGVCAPTHAVGTPLPTPSVPVTTAPETPLLPNHGIVARVVVEQLLGRVQLSVYPSFCLKGLMHDE